MKKLTVGDLFAGIGGFSLGLEMIGGFQVEWQIEKDPFCQKVLEKHWPNVARFRDVQDCGRGREHPLPVVDVLCGGWPCQPHSLIGKRKASEDERDLWPEFARLIREVQPRWVLGENVLGLLSSENGDFFGTVLGDLAQMGYDAQWGVLRASDTGAPHLRERVFLVAHPTQSGLQIRGNGGSDEGQELATASRSGLLGSHGVETAIGQSEKSWVAQSLLGRVLDGVSSWVDGCLWPAGRGKQPYDWEPPRNARSQQKDRIVRLQALGNAVVPQLVAQIGLSILEYESSSS